MPWLTNVGINVEPIRSLLLTADHVVIEDVQVRPGEGIKSTRTTCVNWGRLVGIAEGLSLPVTIVHPKTWQKVMLAGFGKMDKVSRKAASVSVAQRLWPGTSFMPTERCKRPSDGMAESALIAEWGRRVLKGVS
jgi:hypothetical protein